MMEARRCQCGVMFIPKSYQQKRCDACRFAPTLEASRTPGRSARFCLRCGKVFSPLNSRDVYCGDSCRAYRRPSTRLEKTCDSCGTSYRPITNQKYCPHCLKAGVRKRPTLSFQEMACPMCGKLFTPRRRDQNVCSANCRQRRFYHGHTKTGDKVKVT